MSLPARDAGGCIVSCVAGLAVDGRGAALLREYTKKNDEAS